MQKPIVGSSFSTATQWSRAFGGTCCVLIKKSERSTPSALQASHCCCPVFSTKAMPPVSKEPSKGTWMVTACTAMSGREG